MTIIIKAYQVKGIKSDKLENEFEFCCWDSLERWLKEWELYSCPKCQKKFAKEIENENL